MKRSGYAQRVREASDRRALGTQRFFRQLSGDVAEIVLNREFGFGRERLTRFAEAFDREMSEVAAAWNGDTKDTEHTRSLIDRQLERIFGDEFIPWEERYGA